VRRLVLALVFVGGAASAQHVDALDRVLGGIERAPTESTVRALGPTAAAQLIKVADDPSTTRVRRMRAIYALRFVPSESAHAFLRQVVKENQSASEGAEVLDYAAALGSLAPYGEADLPVMLAALDHPSADARQAAAAALAQVRSPRAESALTLRLAVERDVGVRRHLTLALRALH
jgi:HEAT repeat protein